MALKQRNILTNRKFWMVSLTLVAGVLSGITAGSYLVLTHDLPQIQKLQNFQPSAITRIYSMDHVLLAELFVEKRMPVPLQEIPSDLVKSLLTIEDRRFYQHSGIALRGIIRAVVKNIISGRYAEGASTITQQLSKTLFLTPKKTILRKLREAVLSIQLERRYTKDEILELYLNQIYLGSGAYGVASAAQVYFGKPLSALSLSECAIIAGLPQAPSRYSPHVNPTLCLKRRNIVLNQMMQTNEIDAAAYKQALAEPLVLAENNSQSPAAPYFVDYLKTSLESAIGDGLLYKGGLTVQTTLSYKLQLAAEAAVADGLEQLGSRRHIYQLPEGLPQAALIAIDVQTGGIMSMIGGRNYAQSSFNRASKALRQPGSAIKPLFFAAAIEKGFNQTDTLLDAPVVFQRSEKDQDWQPNNFSNTYEGEISMRYALVHSKNIPAVRLLEKIGPTAAVQFIHSLGISADLTTDLSLALGTPEVNLLELTAAYAVFADRGKYIQPFGIIEVLDSNGNMLWRKKPLQRIAMSRAGAAIITDMLTGVIREGTGRQATVLPGPVAGKTGTTDDFKDALFIGYSPSVAAGVWVGTDHAQSLGPKETGAKAALPIWIEFMQQAIQTQSQRYFDIPDDVRAATVDLRTGAPLAGGSPTAVKVLVKNE
jgi:penicillin-binding protein 1A